ncbi:MAG: hypothetical protein LBG92_00290 [Prevotellaceae bacterium]|jgi:hypothetical protein|nr:hypothetical protein [Prevotellaceae bacterium]
MTKKINIALDFEIDGLTNSIRNAISGDSFETEVSRLKKTDLSQVSKKNKWLFDWKSELSDNSREISKLTTLNSPDIIHGLMSISLKTGYVYINLLESAPFNLGINKLYEGVAGNLVAYACRISFQHGFDGYVSFTAKTRLITHYQKTLGASLYGTQTMIINTLAANKLIDKYFKNR